MVASLEKSQARFVSRVEFVGLRANYGRGEAADSGKSGPVSTQSSRPTSRTRPSIAEGHRLWL